MHSLSSLILRKTRQNRTQLSNQTIAQLTTHGCRYGHKLNQKLHIYHGSDLFQTITFPPYRRPALPLPWAIFWASSFLTSLICSVASIVNDESYSVTVDIFSEFMAAERKRSVKDNHAHSAVREHQAVRVRRHGVGGCVCRIPPSGFFGIVAFTQGMV